MQAVKQSPLYWLTRLLINGLAVAVFFLATKLVGVQFSWSLYWCAFAVYAVLSLGDAAVEQLWPARPATGEREC